MFNRNSTFIHSTLKIFNCAVPSILHNLVYTVAMIEMQMTNFRAQTLQICKTLQSTKLYKV